MRALTPPHFVYYDQPGRQPRTCLSSRFHGSLPVQSHAHEMTSVGSAARPPKVGHAHQRHSRPCAATTRGQEGKTPRVGPLKYVPPQGARSLLSMCLVSKALGLEGVCKSRHYSSSDLVFVGRTTWAYMVDAIALG